MNITVDQNGMAGFFRALDAGVARGTGRAAAVYVSEIKSSFGRSGSGGGPIGTVTHVPSAPGSPPNVQTGHLRNSVGFDIKAPFRAAIGTNVEYGLYLELGTSKMAPRPFMRPIAADRRIASRARDEAAREIARSIASAKAAVIGGGS